MKPFRSLLLVGCWFLLLPVTLALVATSTKYRQSYLHTQAQNLEAKSPVIANAGSVPMSAFGQVKGISTTIEVEDARPKIVENFLRRHQSPMEPHDEYAKKIVEIADRHNIDFRLLPAIAMQESNLCKKIPAGTYNCLGFGIHERGTLGFDTYEAGFERAARELKKNYIDRGLTTPREIMRKYTPSSNGSWEKSVNQWIAEMRFDDRDKGRADDGDHDLLEYVK